MNTETKNVAQNANLGPSEDASMTQDALKQKIQELSKNLSTDNFSQFSECLGQLDDYSVEINYHLITLLQGHVSSSDFSSVLIYLYRQDPARLKRMAVDISIDHLFLALHDIVDYKALLDLDYPWLYGSWINRLHSKCEHEKIKDMIEAIPTHLLKKYLNEIITESYRGAVPLMSKEGVAKLAKYCYAYDFIIILESLPEICFSLEEAMEWEEKDNKIWHYADRVSDHLLAAASIKTQKQYITEHPKVVPSLKKAVLESSKLELLENFFHEIEWDEDVFEAIQELKEKSQS